MATKAKTDPLVALAEGNPALLYGIDGEERVLVDEALKTIKKTVLKSGPVDFNFDVFTGKDAVPARVIDAALTLPVFSAFRLVLVKDADEIAASESERLVDYAESPSPSTVLVLVAKKFDARTRLYKAIQKNGAVLRFDRPKLREMPALVKSRARMFGVKIEDGAIQALVEAIGNDVAAVISAIEKLGLYAGDRPISSADVEETVTHAKEESVFDLSDAIGARDRQRALALLWAMLEVSRTHPLALLGMIARQFRHLIQVRAWQAEGLGSNEVAQRLGLPPFIATKLNDQARRHRLEALTRGLVDIAAADEALKGGALESARVMERLVLSLTR